MTARPNYISPPRTAYEAFEMLPEGTLCQIIDNKLIMSPSPELHHQITINELLFQLNLFIKENNLGICIPSPIDVYFDDKNVFQQDILFISNENKSIIKDGKIKGAPDLIIEILSPSTEKNDLGKKKIRYEKFGVIEYWTINPKDKSTIIRFLENGKYIEYFTGTKKAKSKLFNKIFNF